MLNKLTIMGLLIACAILSPLAMAGNTGVPVFLDAKLAVTEIVKGNPITIMGTMNGTPLPVTIWVIGDYDARVFEVRPDTSGNYSLILNEKTVDIYFLGKYQVIVQHPGQDGLSNVYLTNGKAYSRNGSEVTSIDHLEIPYKIGSLRGEKAVSALKIAIENTDDVTKELSFSYILPNSTPTMTTQIVTTATTEIPKIITTAKKSTSAVSKSHPIITPYIQETQTEEPQDIIEIFWAFLKSLISWE